MRCGNFHERGWEFDSKIRLEWERERKWVASGTGLQLGISMREQEGIGGFKGEAGEALPPQILLTLKFVVCIALKIMESVATWCDILGLKGSKFDFGWGSAPNPARGARSAPRPPADPIPALGPPDLETTCLPKYVSLNPPMVSARHTRT